jgi:glycine dehydrogenase subunit 1
MSFIPNKWEKEAMLKAIGCKTIEDLFSDIPKEFRIASIKLPSPLSEIELKDQLKEVLSKSISFEQMPAFFGGGVMPHWIPAALEALLSRSEFYSAYFSYQPEASYGMLQTLFEYQSMICELTGMDVAPIGLYDSASALGEAARMCARITKKREFLVPENMAWEKRSVLTNYTKGSGVVIKEVPYDRSNGKIDLSLLEKQITKRTAGVYLENPNFFGIIEDRLETIQKVVKKEKTLLVVGVDLLSLGLIKPPPEWGADLVIGEGQVLGSPLNFGGSLLGVMTSKREFMRQLPGRIVGLTKDKEGKSAFCFTLQTRDQFIRRGKASSNICTAETLHACAAAIYLALLGREGLVKLARWNFERGYRLKQSLKEIKQVELPFAEELNFNQLLLRYKRKKAARVQKALLAHGIQGGLILTPQFPELGEVALYGITELHQNKHIEKLVKALKEIT